MAIRGFPVQTLTGSAVPVFGTTLAAALAVTPDMYTGNTQPASQRSTATGTVVSGIFRKGDRVLVGTAAEIVAGTCDSASISGVAGADDTTVTFQGLTRAHASGEFVVLALSVAAVLIRAVSLAGSDVVYVGEDDTAGASSATLVDIITTATDPFRLGPSAIGNVFDTQHIWMNGTSMDTVLASVVIV